MPSTTALSLEQLTTELFQAVDSLDLDRIGTYFTDDTQSVDELSGGWLRGRAALEDYLKRLKDSVQNVESRLSSLQATEWSDSGLVTFVLDQTYRIGDQEQQIHAPTTLVLTRQDGDWKILLFHSVPLPEESTS